MQPNEYALLTDLYQLTMAQGYWECGKTDEQACFHMYYRQNPFKGGYAIACGMDGLASLIENFRFDEESIEYLASLDAPGGGKLFKRGFLDYLANMRLTVDVDAVHEGTVVFPNDPLVRVMGPIMQCQLLETALLNLVSFETLIATKTARVCLEAKTPVAEFGLRRAQGESGGNKASRAAIVGGCASTSNVLAGKLYGLPVSGTHAHSWVMAFDDELEAFREYARVFPTNCVLLIDTYDIEKGLANAITVAREMRERGQRLTAVRIDSGDLAWEAKRARATLDEAGFPEVGIVLSNDLDEFTVKSIRDAGAPVNSWGIGTKLATAFDQPSLGGVYKLGAKRDGDGEWRDCLKVTGSVGKLTFPGVLDVRRYFHENGKVAGDMVYDVNRGITCETIVDPADELRQKDLSGKSFETLLRPLARSGKVVLAAEFRDALCARDRAKAQLELLDDSQKRLVNPHSYPVGLECGLFKRRRDLAARQRGLEA